MPITHSFISIKADTTDASKVQASHWNAPHVFENVFIDEEVPSGIKNGSNLIFTILNMPNPVNSLKVYLNGVRMRLGLGYTFSGKTITFTTGYEPGPLDTIICDYRME